MMRWTVETFSNAVDAEIEALPKDMRARFVRLAETIEQLGFEALPFAAVNTLRRSCGNFALAAAMEFLAPSTSRRPAVGW